MFFVKVFFTQAEKTCSLLRWERGGEDLLLNYTGDQFAAAGFTFLLFDVFDPKVNLILLLGVHITGYIEIILIS